MQNWTGYDPSLDFVPDFFLNSSFLTLNFLFLTSDFLTGSAESESKSPNHHRVQAARALEARKKLKSEGYACRLYFDADCKVEPDLASSDKVKIVRE